MDLNLNIIFNGKALLYIWSVRDITLLTVLYIESYIAHSKYYKYIL